MNMYPYISFFSLCALYLISCTWIGFAFLTILFNKSKIETSYPNGYLSLFFSMTLGVSVHISVLFLLGLCHQLNAQIIGVSNCLIITIATAIIFKNSKKLPLYFNTHPNKVSFLLNLIIIISLFTIVTSFALHAPGNWDDTSYHLPYAQYYLDHQSLQVDPYLRFPLFPNHMDLLFSFGLLYGGVPLAQALATLPLFIIAIGLIGAGKQFLNSYIAGVLAFGLLMYLEPIRGTLGYAYIDNGLALFCWAGLLALMQIDQDKDNKTWIVLAVIYAGTAADIKLFGVVWTFFLCLYLLCSTKSLYKVIIFGLGSMIIGSWWYLRSFFISGDPIHPFGAPLFGFYLWNAQDLLSQNAEQASHGVVKNIAYLWTALVDAKVTWIFPAFLAPLFFRRIDRPIKFGYLVFLGYFLFWFYVTQVDRYLIPALVVGCFLVVYVGYRSIISNLVRRLKVQIPILNRPIMSYLGIFICLGIFIKPICATTLQNIHDWNSTLESRTGYVLYQHANNLSPSFGKNLIQVGFENGIFFYHGLSIGDWFGPGRYAQFITCKEKCVMIAPDQIIPLMNHFNSRILMINTERFNVDLASYQNYFDIQYRTKDGYLMTKKTYL